MESKILGRESMRRGNSSWWKATLLTDKAINKVTLTVVKDLSTTVAQNV